MTTVIQADVVELFYVLLSTDTVLKDIEGLTVHKEMPTSAMGSTSDSDNKRVIINKEGEIRLEPKTGCQGVILSERVRIHTIVKSAPSGENARDQANIIRKRMRELLILTEFLGTGWLYHNETEDRWPTPPTAVRAYHVLGYDVVTTLGKTS